MIKALISMCHLMVVPQRVLLIHKVLAKVLLQLQLIIVKQHQIVNSIVVKMEMTHHKLIDQVNRPQLRQLPLQHQLLRLRHTHLMKNTVLKRKVFLRESMSSLLKMNKHKQLPKRQLRRKYMLLKSYSSSLKQDATLIPHSLMLNHAEAPKKDQSISLQPLAVKI